jgi:hypothetical protein
MNRGYIRLWRKFLDGGYVKNHRLCAFMIWCLLKANHHDGYVAVVGLQRITLKPGDFVFGRKKAVEETGLSEQEIRTIIAFLKKIKFLTIKTTNKFSLISIINWPIYQAINEGNQPSNQPTTNQQLTTYKNNRTKTFLSDSIEIRLSELLLKKIISRNPNHKKPNLQTWARDIDRMIRIDHRTPQDIRTVIEWCQADTFWQSNILSTAKLREKFDQLTAKMGGVKKGW